MTARVPDTFDDEGRGVAPVVLLIVCAVLAQGCGPPPPRDESLPASILVADFSLKDAPLTEHAVRYGNFEGAHAPLVERSTAEVSQVEVDGGHALLVDYRLGTRLATVASCGLWIELKPSILRKDWSAVACELRTDSETATVEGVAVGARCPPISACAYFNISKAWRPCVLPITWANAGTAGEEQRLEHIMVQLTSGITDPKQGKIMVRRVYLLKSEHDLPSDLREFLSRRELVHKTLTEHLNRLGYPTGHLDDPDNLTKIRVNAISLKIISLENYRRALDQIHGSGIPIDNRILILSADFTLVSLPTTIWDRLSEDDKSTCLGPETTFERIFGLVAKHEGKTSADAVQFLPLKDTLFASPLGDPPLALKVFTVIGLATIAGLLVVVIFRKMRLRLRRLGRDDRMS